MSGWNETAHCDERWRVGGAQPVLLPRSAMVGFDRCLKQRAQHLPQHLRALTEQIE